eukprot:m.38866 g.38866  ORF g.38866 m.38866 type:complete len:76 (+) comp6823_c0_seq2:101-328(+)
MLMVLRFLFTPLLLHTIAVFGLYHLIVSQHNLATVITSASTSSQLCLFMRLWCRIGTLASHSLGRWFPKNKNGLV